MTKLKLGSLVNDKPVKLSIELPPSVHRDLVAEVLARETGQSIAEPAKLLAPARREWAGIRRQEKTLAPPLHSSM